ncbi:MAG: GNAT family N-acetyltransferase [Boseongicola sp.]|nr:GNAT family N-acetyltransferase [Silicimonas sp.]NNF92572.1 GNAT family N-acetyltransferase [Boseongicola sp.]RZW08883.1 MAG: N-acetyltransferase [Paracoccaceae bacterium]NND20558.1 GNAT family N-acetyltransferase [Silicimonas sp.]NND42588.1 GNAT family N-acetyltransferase [Silicimonas sp.]
MLRLKGKIRIDTDRMVLRPPVHADYRNWADLREESAEFLKPWEPSWSADHLTRKGFVNRVYWANRSIAQGTALPLFLIRRTDRRLLGAITLDNIRRGPAQAGTIGYWVGEHYARQGWMREALTAVVHHAFEVLDLSRLESACLPENTASRGLLERCGYKYEGVAQSYLQINGRWRNHVLYANLRGDRRGRVGS